MQIITALPRYSDGEIDRAIFKELKTGHQLLKAREEFRDNQAALEAQTFKGHKAVKGLGKCVAVWDQGDYLRMVKKYGHEEVNSKDFLRTFQKLYPHLSPNRV